MRRTRIGSDVARTIILGTALLAGLAGYAVDPGPSAVAVAKDPAKGEPIATELGRQMDRAIVDATGGRLWGTVLVARGGRVELAMGYGFADYDTVPNAPDTLFELASASKQVTATAILRLEQQKKLKTSDPIDKFFKDVPKDKHAVTLDHLLHHTSGLDKSLGVPYAWTGGRAQYAKQMLERPLATAPGAKFSYSNVGYALLAAVVEEVTGKQFEDYCRKELFAAAGLSDTGFIGDAALVKSPRVSKRDCEKPDMAGTAAQWFWGWGYRGMGGVVTTVLDVLAWDRALRGDKVLGEAAKAKLYTPALDNYACGWTVETTDRGTRKAWHSGGVCGYRTLISRWLEEDVLVVVLGNDKGDPFAVERAIAPLLFPPPRITAEIDVAGVELTEHRVRSVKEGLSIDVDAPEGGLRLRLREKDHVLVSIRAPKTLSKALAAQLESALASSRYETPDDAAALEGGVFLGFLSDRGEKIRLEEGLSLRVQPRYVGSGPNGRVEDERAVLILESQNDHGWPVMLHMNPKAVRSLLDALKKV